MIICNSRYEQKQGKQAIETVNFRLYFKVIIAVTLNTLHTATLRHRKRGITLTWARLHMYVKLYVITLASTTI